MAEPKEARRFNGMPGAVTVTTFGQSLEVSPIALKLWLLLQRQDVAFTKINLRRLELQNIQSNLPVVTQEGPVVSVTTYGARIKTVHLVLESIAAGSVLPSRLVLWVDDLQVFRNPPAPLKRLARRGLEIRLTEDYGPHKKYYPYLISANHFDEPLVTADDDVLYSGWWLAGLVGAHNENPDVVNCYRAYVVRTAEDQVMPYHTWRRCESTEPNFSYFPTGNSGCLYPVRFLQTLKRAGDGFRQLCPRGDDIWLHANAMRAGFRIKQIRSWPINFPSVPGTQRHGLSRLKAERIDEQIRKTYTARDIALLKSSAREAHGVSKQHLTPGIRVTPPVSGSTYTSVSR
jgi:hypothetical protein